MATSTAAEMSRIVRLQAPNQLPESGLTSVKFRPWRTHVQTYLCQNPNNELFIEGGDYEKWLPQTTVLPNKRISELKGKDAEYPSDAQIKKEASAAAGRAEADYVPTQAEKDDAKAALIARRLSERNRQLSMMVQQVALFCNDTEQEEIVDRCDSLEWIWTFLRAFYNIEAKGANILRITEHTYKSGVNPTTFYKQFRASVVDNLRKKGCRADPRIPTDRLAADEKLTPTTEDLMIIWSLYMIDPRLPAKVRKEYEGRLHGDTFLWDLQTQIFQAIPSLLEELDKEASLSALTTSRQGAEKVVSPTYAVHNHAAPIQALAGASLQGRGRPVFRGSGRGSGGRGGGRGGNGGGRGRGGTRRPWSEKFCKICHAANQPPAVYTAHNTVNCSVLTLQDRQEFLVASLQSLELEQEEEEFEDYEAEEEGEELQGSDNTTSS